jgi:hypothetical protein
MYTGSSARIHRCEKLAGHRVRTAFMRRLPKVVHSLLALPAPPARDDALSVPPRRSPRYTGTLRKVCPHRVDSSLGPMFIPLRQRNRSSILKAALGSEPVPHMVLTHGTRKTAQPLGHVSTPTYERGVAKEVRDRTIHVPISRFLKVYKSEL